MSRFRKVSITIIILEIVLMVVMNILLINRTESQSRYYAVEAERVVRQLEADEALRDSPEKIDLSKYDTLKRVSFFDSEEICNNSYVVEKVDGREYRIEYEVKTNKTPQILMNVGMVTFFIITILVFIYIGRKVLAPFNKMSNMTVDLAKGHLTDPMKEEKNRFFGKFLNDRRLLQDTTQRCRN